MKHLNSILLTTILSVVFTIGFQIGHSRNHHDAEISLNKEGDIMLLEKLYSLLVLARSKKFVDGNEPVIVRINSNQTYETLIVNEVHLVMERGRWSLQLTAIREPQQPLLLPTEPERPRAEVEL